MQRPARGASWVFEDASAGDVRHEYEFLPILATEGRPPSPAQACLATPLLGSVLGSELGDAAGREGGGHGELACTAHLAKAILGVGITALPHAFLLLGAIPATAAFLLIGALTYYSCECLVRGSVATGRSTYSGVMVQQLGRWASVALDVSMILNCFGMMTVMLIVVGDVLSVDADAAGLAGDDPAGPAPGSPAWPPSLPELLASRRLVLAAATVFVLAPLLSFRKLKHTTVVSGLGVAAIAVWAVATMALAGRLEVRRAGHAVALWPRWDFFSGPPARALLHLAAVLPVILCAYMCQQSFFSIVYELRPYTAGGMRRSTAAAVCACFLLFMIQALGSQVLFGDDVAPNVLRSFSVDGLLPTLGGALGAARAVVWAVRVLYLLSVLASFPLQMKPFRDSAVWLVAGEAGVAKVYREDSPAFYLVTYATLAGVYVAAAAVPSVWVPLQLVGATAGALIAFILPGLLVMRLPAGQGGGRWDRAGGALLVAVGGVAAVAGVVSVLLPD